MKYKYTFLKNRLFYDEILIPYLDKMSKKGQRGRRSTGQRW